MAGKIIVADISMPEQVKKEAEEEAELIDRRLLSQIYKPYPQDAHKGTFGRTLIIAGSKGMTGACALAGKAAARCGAGLVTIGIPESLNDILASKVTEVMTLPLEENFTSISEKALDKALEFSLNCDAVAIGPGLSQNPETKSFVRSFVRRCRKPLVIDADGLNALAEDIAAFKDAQCPIIITPHPGEMARLLSTTIEDIQANRVKSVKMAAEKFSSVAVLKGASTLLATKEGKLFINPTGNPGMATGGSGDVLTGIIVGFLARGFLPKEAAISAIYVHGLAGDLAAQKFGEISMLAGDIIDFIPKAIKTIWV
jgi:hydroxyethylthiazole kinase-like uncharacterized protein yjeF